MSKTTVADFAQFSNAVPFFISSPRAAPLPIPAISAIGVARPSAQGQAATMTDSAQLNAVANAAPEISHKTSVSSDSEKIIQVNTPATLSANAAIGGREF